jgi:Family of unknown function (DUF6298)
MDPAVPKRRFVPIHESTNSQMIAFLVMVLVTQFGFALAQSRPDPAKRFVYSDSSGTLVYESDSLGNRIPDFSFSGCFASGRPLPTAVARVIVTLPSGDLKADQTQRIQSAIDFVSQLPLSVEGVRGAVELVKGDFCIESQLSIRNSGVVLRGSATGQSRLIATGLSRRAVIDISGESRTVNKEFKKYLVASQYVPCGSIQLQLDSVEGLSVGDEIQVTHHSSQEWIASLGMDQFPTDDRGSWLDWKPGEFDVQWYRTIESMEGNQIILDAPLTMSLNAALAQSCVEKVDSSKVLSQVGVEQLSIVSRFDHTNPLDEQHAWDGIRLDQIEDAWIRNVNFQHLSGSAVIVLRGGRRITVDNCHSTKPVSEVAGLRRRTFFTCGQQTLFRNCTSQSGIHDFAVGYLAPGPNAFVHCRADETHGFSGPVESWASGVLYDNVVVDGGGLRLTNLETFGQGVGWAAVNSVMWQCVAPQVECRHPPSANNWAIGCWGGFIGNGHWRSMDEFVSPNSLFEQQLAERQKNTKERTQDNRTVGASNDLPHTAASPIRVDNLPDSPVGRNSIGEGSTKGGSKRTSVRNKSLRLTNGWLTIDGHLATGKRLTMPWWRGKLQPARAAESGSAITRFVPSRTGPGYTDDLDQVTDSMVARNQIIAEHHWGLWYDRRRDDHEMVRRMDGQVWGPFYEQPWARSGQGKAWDGLSKYDLNKFNTWYFDRLKSFSQLASRKGLVLLQEMYFQHNILEAGAHWADFPWRSANCLQATGFAEPPPYFQKKRIFQADEFYDVSHPVRRQLHQGYIRHCLETLSEYPNVIFSLGEEFTGPIHFVKFWLDTIAQWQQESGRNSIVCLSCTKDVQDAILEDPEYSRLVDVIEMKYWWYTTNGELYAPAGGQNLAPRQQLREWKGDKSRTDETLARQISEYRSRYPEKAVISALSSSDGWRLVNAGCSLAPTTGAPPADFDETKLIGLKMLD